ncbi:MAG: hypothetical protein ACR2QX_13260 [Woeseiaceae bacterium]
MASSSKVVDWQKLREFADVDLERSFVLSWNYEAGALLVDIDLLLLPEHPFYEKPRPAEKVCIRPALIEFPFCQAVITGKGDDDIAAIVASLENGAITGLRLLADGYYEISGVFGSVEIEAERPLLRLKSP